MTGADRLLAACRGEEVDATPVWFMRQAGGRLPRYVALRDHHSVIEIAKTPALCAEVTLAAVDDLGVDGAVLFADIMLLVEAMGVDLELTSAGPIVERPIHTAEDVANLRAIDPATDLGFVLDAIRLVCAELGGRAGLGGRAAVVGILGGPFTLASYLIEGGPSRDQLAARIFMHARPGDWHALLGRLADASVRYALAQVEAGAQVVQLFDTWASALTPAEYEAFVAPYSRRILAALTPHAPSVHYVARSASLLPTIAATGATVVAIDSRQDLGEARARLGPAMAVQGNLDPALLMAGWRQAAAGADAVIAANRGRPGHVFNLGESAPRDADPRRLRDLAVHVHDRTAAAGRRTEEPVDALA